MALVLLLLLLLTGQCFEGYAMDGSSAAAQKENCAICWDPLTTELVAIPGCGGTEGLHTFHQGCLNGWQAVESQKDRDKCPTCKAMIPEDLILTSFASDEQTALATLATRLAQPDTIEVAAIAADPSPSPTPARQPQRRKSIKRRILGALCCGTQSAVDQ